MRLRLFVILSASALGACAPLQPTHSWSDLGRRLSTGSRVAVVDQSGAEVRGRVAAFTADSLTLNVFGAPRRLDSSTVREVRRDGDPLWNGLAIGAAIGAAGALLSDSSCSGRSRTCTDIPQRLAFVAVMAAAGAGLDALHRDRTVLYRSAGQSASTASR